MNWFRKLYDWIISWSQSKYGPVVLFFLAFVESVFFPIPPDILLIALALGASSRAFKYALICTSGSVLGAFVGYYVGHILWLTSGGAFSPFANFFFTHIPGFSVELYESIRNLFIEWDFWVIFTAGFTPIPYKVFTISAGAFEINLAMFAFASLVSRGARFFLISWLIWQLIINLIYLLKLQIKRCKIYL